MIGPQGSVPAAYALAIDAHVAAGGALLVAVRSERATTTPAAGLELVLENRGIVVEPAVVIDPGAEVGGNLWATSRGYGEHPITKPFKRRGIETDWPAPRAVRAKSGIALVVGSPKSWAERDLAAVFSGQPISADAGETLGSVSIAVATTGSGGRAVVLGSAEAAASQFVSRGLGAGHILAARALRWLVGRDVDIAIEDKSPEHLRVVMDSKARSITFFVAVVLVPLLWLVLFGAIVWRRRRG